MCEKLLSSGRIDLSDRNERDKFKAKLIRYGYGFETVSSVVGRFCAASDDEGFN